MKLIGIKLKKTWKLEDDRIKSWPLEVGFKYSVESIDRRDGTVFLKEDDKYNVSYLKKAVKKTKITLKSKGKKGALK